MYSTYQTTSQRPQIAAVEMKKMQRMNIPVEQNSHQQLINHKEQSSPNENLPWVIKKQKHYQQLIATLILYYGAAFVVTFVFISGNIQYYIKHHFSQIAYFLFRFFFNFVVPVVIYPLYLCVGFICNPFLQTFSSISHGLQYQEQCNRIRNLRGFFVFSVECYHYETRHHTRTILDDDGHPITATYTTTQKVVTHTNRQILNPRQCRDYSGLAAPINADKKILVVRYFVNYQFNDEKSRKQFMKQWQDFQKRNKYDTHQEYHQQFAVFGLNHIVHFAVDPKPINYRGWFIFFGLIGAMWPYAVYIQKKISKFTVQFTKVLTF